MKTTYFRARDILWAAVLCCGCIATVQPASAATATDARGGFNLGKLTGSFTIEDFSTVNGISQASGWLTANVTDSATTNQIGSFTNFPVKMPLSGLLSSGSVQVDAIDDPIILPQLSTNSCDILGVVIGAVDVTAPGLGINVHLNEIDLIVRADRDTTIGLLLCNILGSDGLGTLKASPVAGVTTGGAKGLASASPRTSLSVDQMRGLMGILLTGVPGATDTASSKLATTPTPAEAGKMDPKLGAQTFVDQVVTTMKPGAGNTSPAQTKPAAVKPAAQ